MANQYTHDETPWREEDRLRELYVEQQMMPDDIGDRWGCTGKTILQWLDRHGIEKRDPGEQQRRGWMVKPVYLYTRTDGYERWSAKHRRETSHVYVHRLLAVAKYGFDAVTDQDVHHRNNIPWDNRPENIELVSKQDHPKKHTGRSIVQCDHCEEEVELNAKGLCKSCYNTLYGWHRHDLESHDPDTCRWC